MFIPHEVKQKIEDLEKEVKRLNLENQDLNQVKVSKPQKQPIAAIILGILLVLSVSANIFLFKNKTVVVEDNTHELDSVSFYFDNQIIKMSSTPEEGVVYRVQIGAYEEFNLKAYRENLDGLVEDTTGNYTKIVLGGFSNVSEAQAFQQEMARMGLINAYIVAYKNDVAFGVLEADPKEE